MNPTSCIVCDFQPESAFAGEHYETQPYAATTFSSHGHYGSTFFDPMMPSCTIAINVCDSCLTKAVDKQQILLYNNGKCSIHTGEFYD